jgi:hypothetical protein
VRLGEKLKYLREVEGSLRGLGRPMKQQEIVEAVKKETGKKISQSYLSQIEGGARPHLTQATRGLLATFFKVHPGFLVDDPEGMGMELSDLATTDGKLDHWMLQGAEAFRQDPEVSEALLAVARQRQTRNTVLLLGRILKSPGLGDSLWRALGGAGTVENTAAKMAQTQAVTRKVKGTGKTRQGRRK